MRGVKKRQCGELGGRGLNSVAKLANPICKCRAIQLKGMTRLNAIEVKAVDSPKIRDWFCMGWRLALDGGEKLPPAALCSLGGRLFEPHCDLHEQSMAHVAYSGHTSTTHAHIYLTTRNHNVRFVQIPNSSTAPGHCLGYQPVPGPYLGRRPQPGPGVPHRLVCIARKALLARQR